MFFGGIVWLLSDGVSQYDIKNKYCSRFDDVVDEVYSLAVYFGGGKNAEAPSFDVEIVRDDLITYYRDAIEFIYNLLGGDLAGWEPYCERIIWEFRMNEQWYVDPLMPDEQYDPSYISMLTDLTKYIPEEKLQYVEPPKHYV